jgi:nucleoid DNA-binding protein
MDKVDLIQALKDSNHLAKSEADAIINLFFNEVADALAQVERDVSSCMAQGRTWGWSRVKNA